MTPETRCRGTALLVDDDALVRRVVRRELEQLGLQVLEAEDAFGALRKVTESKRAPDVVVSDVRMLGVTGPQLVAELRASYPDLPVLYISGHPEGALDMSSLGKRTRLLAKPFDRAGLVAKLAELLGGWNVPSGSPPTTATRPPRK